jgi:hypothetical protein
MDSIYKIGRSFTTGGTEIVTELCVSTNACFHTEHALIWLSGYILLNHEKFCSFVAQVIDANICLEFRHDYSFVLTFRWSACSNFSFVTSVVNTALRQQGM